MSRALQAIDAKLVRSSLYRLEILVSHPFERERYRVRDLQIGHTGRVAENTSILLSTYKYTSSLRWI